LKTPAQRVGEVLSALAEGLDIAAAVRVFRHSEGTISRWLTRAGMHSASMHECWFHGLHSPHLQLDELRTRLRSRTHILWLWLAIDPITKLIPVLHLGTRTQATAHMVVHSLRQKLAPDCLPVFTSDGLSLYFYALTAHFGQWVVAAGRRTRQWQVAADLIYGQVKKRYRRRQLVGVTQLMRCGTRQQLRVALQEVGLSGRLNTAFIERVNLTIRQSVAPLVRRTWSTAQAAPQLLAHLEWWRGYYHFVRPHAALTQPIDRGGKHQPPTLPAAHAGDGGWADEPTLGRGRSARRSTPAGSRRRCVTARIADHRALQARRRCRAGGYKRGWCSDEFEIFVKTGIKCSVRNSTELSTIADSSTHLGVPLLILLCSVGTTILSTWSLHHKRTGCRRDKWHRTWDTHWDTTWYMGGNQYPVRGCGAVISQP
jgi:IS1 family transposase